MTANTVNTTFVVKITHANELRRGVCPTVSYAALCELVSKLFTFENYVSLVLKYKDDEGDLITLSSDEELYEALRVNNTDEPIRLFVATNNPQCNNPAPHPDPQVPASALPFARRGRHFSRRRQQPVKLGAAEPPAAAKVFPDVPRFALRGRRWRLQPTIQAPHLAWRGRHCRNGQPNSQPRAGETSLDFALRGHCWRQQQLDGIAMKPFLRGMRGGCLRHHHHHRHPQNSQHHHHFGFVAPFVAPHAPRHHHQHHRVPHQPNGVTGVSHPRQCEFRAPRRFGPIMSAPVAHCHAPRHHAGFPHHRHHIGPVTFTRRDHQHCRTQRLTPRCLHAHLGRFDSTATRPAGQIARPHGPRCDQAHNEPRLHAEAPHMLGPHRFAPHRVPVHCGVEERTQRKMWKRDACSPFRERRMAIRQAIRDMKSKVKPAEDVKAVKVELSREEPRFKRFGGVPILRGDTNKFCHVKTENNNSEQLRARLVADLTIPDESELPANTPATKTWRLRNRGTTAWPAGCHLIAVGRRHGDRLNGPEKVSVGSVAPGQVTEVSIPFITPNQPGHYVAFYRMATAEGTRFGQRVWTSFVVPSVPQN